MTNTPKVNDETLKDLEQCAFDGLKDRDIAMKQGISYDQFKLLIRTYPTLGKALANGRLRAVRKLLAYSWQSIEDALAAGRPPPVREMDRLYNFYKYFEPQATDKDFDDNIDTPESIKEKIKNFMKKDKE